MQTKNISQYFSQYIRGRVHSTGEKDGWWQLLTSLWVVSAEKLLLDLFSFLLISTRAKPPPQTKHSLTNIWSE